MTLEHPYSSGDYHFGDGSDAGRLIRLPVEQRDNGEWKSWEAPYLPPKNVPKDALIVDVGAEEGNTAVFFFEHGYTNLRLIEPHPPFFENLVHNAEVLRSLGCKVDLCLEPFRADHLKDAGFIKIDAEGAEWEIDLANLGIPWGGELHMKTQPDANGRYDYYISIGRFRGDGRKHIRQLDSDVMEKKNWTFFFEE